MGATAQKGGECDEQGEMPPEKGRQEAWAEERICAYTQTFFAQAYQQEVQLVS